MPDTTFFQPLPEYPGTHCGSAECTICGPVYMAWLLERGVTPAPAPAPAPAPKLPKQHAGKCLVCGTEQGFQPTYVNVWREDLGRYWRTAQDTNELREIVDLGRKGFVHHACKRSRDDKNHSRYGLPDGKPMFSLEIETDARFDNDQDMTLALLYHGYHMTNDGTVQVEYLSPRYLSYSAAVPALREIDKWARAAITGSCGSHIHCDCPSQQYSTWDIARPFLLYVARQDNDTIRQFWGRELCDWALPQTGTRYSVMNMESHYPTIEWRLAKFRNYAQYRHVIRFCRDATQLVNEAFNQAGANRGLTYAATDVLGKSIVDTYQKHLLAAGL